MSNASGPINAYTLYNNVDVFFLQEILLFSYYENHFYVSVIVQSVYIYYAENITHV